MILVMGQYKNQWRLATCTGCGPYEEVMNIINMIFTCIC